MPDDPKLREFAATTFIEAFGEPEKFRTIDGTLYRWILKCAGGRKVRVTLDSPEFPDLAHFLISDNKAVVRLTAETARTRGDVLALLERLRECERLEVG
jgi:hypothetical protein